MSDQQNNQQNLEHVNENNRLNILLKSEYPKDFNHLLLEQYKLYVEMADRVSARRIQSASFFTSILSALLALLPFITNKEISQELSNFFLMILSLLGLCLCLLWAANINSYKQLNSLKFQVIHEMERYLAFPCYDLEWQILKEDRNNQRYFRLTAIERYIPILISLPYLSIFIYSLTQF